MIGSPHLDSRQKKIIASLKILKLDGLLLTSEPNVSYAAGFRAPDTYALISKEGIDLFTDFRYLSDFKRHLRPGLRLVQTKKTVFQCIDHSIRQLKIKKVGFESRNLNFAECRTLHKITAKAASFIPCDQTIEMLREIKDDQEIQTIQRAVRITLETYRFIEKQLKPGKTELQIAGEIERHIRLQGATSSAFETIVASGANASYPHAQVTTKKIKNGEPVVIDMGVTLEGYKCDLTRTFFLGKMPPIVHKAARVVQEAQRRAICAVKPGVPFRKIDATARHYIAAQGFGKNFGHALGHGVGLEVHEAPSVNHKNSTTVQPGQIFTIEPGIYVAGVFGIRFEEMVCVKEKKVEVMSGNTGN